jgi:hypothetical protein
MKSLLLLAAAAFAPLLGLAQGAAPLPAAPSPSPAAASSPSAGATRDAAATVPLPGQPSGPTLERNIPLIPETAPGTSRSSSHSARAHPGGSPHEFATFQTEQDIRTRIRIREAQNRALNDPGIQADWVAAYNTRTDVQHRALLTVYYNHLYDRIIHFDPSDADRANLRRASILARMKYTRLGDEDTSENPFVAPTPEPSGPNPPSSETSQ